LANVKILKTGNCN